MEDTCVECSASNDEVADIASVHGEKGSSLDRTKEGEGNQVLDALQCPVNY